MAILLSWSQLPCIWEGSQLPCWSSGINRMKNSNKGHVLSSGLGTGRPGRIVCSMKVATHPWPFQGNHKFHRSQGFTWLLNQRTVSDVVPTSGKDRDSLWSASEVSPRAPHAIKHMVTRGTATRTHVRQETGWEGASKPLHTENEFKTDMCTQLSAGSACTGPNDRGRRARLAQ